MDENGNKQVVETRDTEERQGNTNINRQSVTTSETVGGMVILRRVIYYITGVIVALLIMRLLLLLLSANQGSPFVDFIYGVSGVFASPFYGIFSYQPAYGQSVFEVSTLVAIAVYILVGVGIAKLLSLTSSREQV